MIDLPIGKALIAVYADKQCKRECKNDNYQCIEYKDCCKDCKLSQQEIEGPSDDDICGCLCCIPEERRDAKHVIYKLVDYHEGIVHS